MDGKHQLILIDLLVFKWLCFRSANFHVQNIHVPGPLKRTACTWTCSLLGILRCVLVVSYNRTIRGGWLLFLTIPWQLSHFPFFFSQHQTCLFLFSSMVAVLIRFVSLYHNMHHLQTCIHSSCKYGQKKLHINQNDYHLLLTAAMVIYCGIFNLVILVIPSNWHQYHHSIEGRACLIFIIITTILYILRTSSHISEIHRVMLDHNFMMADSFPARQML